MRRRPPGDRKEVKNSTREEPLFLSLSLWFSLPSLVSLHTPKRSTYTRYKSSDASVHGNHDKYVRRQTPLASTVQRNRLGMSEGKEERGQVCKIAFDQVRTKSLERERLA